MSIRAIKAGVILLLLNPCSLAAPKDLGDKQNSLSVGTLEHVTVTATHNPFSKLASTSHALSSVVAQDPLNRPSSLAEMISAEVGVAENGQPGLFQVSSIRGVSRQRVLTLIDGIRLTSERRAGVAASFVDPLLLQRVDILRGPSSTLYGSGALGGTLQLVPIDFTGVQWHLGYQIEGDEKTAQAGWGNEQWSVAGAKRRAGNSEDINGEELNTGFSQWSAVLKWDGRWADKNIAFMWLPSRGKDIGRSNSRFPQRVVDVPKESHDLLSVSVLDDSGWAGKLYMHDQRLTTKTLRPGERINEVVNEGLDVGGNLQRSWSALNAETLLGVDYFGRRNVDSIEHELRFGTEQTVRTRTLNNAHKDEWALYGSWTRQWFDSRLQLGTRYTYQRDGNKGFASSSDGRLTGFAGWSLTFFDNWEFSINAGTGFRFASLTEKYFSGTTGRGLVAGNPQLDAERAINADIGLRWQGKKSALQAIIFRNQIDDYIERVTIAPQQLTFRNLSAGNIQGLELEATWQWAAQWSARLNAMAIDGEDNKGNPLADIPAERITLRNEYNNNSWSFDLQWQYRRPKNELGSGEMKTPVVNLVSANWRYFLSPQLTFTLSAQNLLDKEYFNSADDLSTFAPGRGFEIDISWRNY